MIKQNKGKAWLSSLLILLPALVGLVLWNDMPESIVTHWGADGVADGEHGRAFAVFGIPCLLLALHWFCLLITAADQKNRPQSAKAMGMVFWITPVVSFLSAGIVYSAAFGHTPDTGAAVLMVLGGMFAIIGNYMPKVRQNRTLGVKLPWTMRNEENWNKTHRVTGRLWVVGGLAMLFSALLPARYAVTVVIAAVVLLAGAPVAYSYALYRRQKREGTYTETATGVMLPPLARAVSLGILVLVLVGVAVLMFTGNIQIACTDEGMEVRATYWNDLRIDYAAIESVEYREDCDAGMRTNGFGSPRLSMGAFENDEFGHYTRYTYTQQDACVVLSVSGQTLVVGGDSEESTRALYEQLSSRLAAQGER